MLSRVLSPKIQLSSPRHGAEAELAEPGPVCARRVTATVPSELTSSLSPDPSVLIAPGLARTRFAIVKNPFPICLENEKCEYHMHVS